jgi:hypothetical protein
MAYQGLQGFSGVVGEVEAATRAVRLTGYPMDPGAAGAYSLSLDNGATVMAAGLAANAEIFQLRYTGTGVLILRSLRFSMGSVAAFVPGRLLIELLVARSWTADGSGGNTANLTGSSAKKRTSFGTTAVGAARVAATATLTAGTKTLDPHPLGSIAIAAPTTVGPILTQASLWQRDTSDEYPIILAQNEGLVVRATVPGTGTWYFNVQAEWAEKAAGGAYP